MAWAQVIVDLWLFEGSFGDFGSICAWSNGWINCSCVCGLSLSAMPWGQRWGGGGVWGVDDLRRFWKVPVSGGVWSLVGIVRSW